jgi:GDP-L-fucose synthase
LEPTNEGYALAKIAILKLCEFISNENKLFHYKTIIPPNLYGRFDKFNPKNSHLLPAIINKIHKAKIENSKEVEIWGDGTARREFMYAGDLANFITIALKQFENLPNILNVGIGYDFSVVEYYNSVANVIGYKGDFKFDLSKPVGIKQKVIDITKLKKIGWLNKVGLEEGIKLTYDYFIKNISNE